MGYHVQRPPPHGNWRVSYIGPLAPNTETGTERIDGQYPTPAVDNGPQENPDVSHLDTPSPH